MRNFSLSIKFAAAITIAAINCRSETRWDKDNAITGVRVGHIIWKTYRKTAITSTEVQCDLRVVRPEVVDTYALLGSNSATSGYTLNDVFTKASPLIAVNGGSTSSFTLPIPSGLVVSNSLERSPLNKSADRSGVVCFGRDSARIVEFYKYNRADCNDGLQASPFLFNKLLNLDNSRFFKNEHPDDRSVVGINSSGDLVFLQVSPISLKDLVDFLRDGPPSLSVAMCLDGSASSGLIINGHPVSRVGTTTSLIASAIVVRSSNVRRSR